MKNTSIKHAMMLLVPILLASVLSCDTKKSEQPYLLINVKKSGVDSTHKLYAVFHVTNNWTSPWLTLNSSSNTIITPQLNVGDFPLFFEVIYDANGNGDHSSTGDLYQGWNGKFDRSTPDMTPLIIPEIPVMILNIDLDTPATRGTMP